MTPDHLRIAISPVMTEGQVARIAAADPRIDVLWEADLYAPQRFDGDYQGELSWVRTPEQQARYEALLDSANTLFGVPSAAGPSVPSPTALRRTVEANPSLMWLHTMEAGGGGFVRTANLRPDDLARLIVTTSAGMHALPLAEFAVYGVLAGAKKLPKMQDLQRRHVWSPRFLMGHICEMTIVVVGMGNIGRLVAKRFVDMGATVIGVNRSLRDVPGVEMHLDDDLIEVATRADAIVNCLPGTPDTDKLISADVLAATPPGVIVVSLGRGTCIDEDAMTALLAGGHIGFAALDVFTQEPLAADSPLWDMDNVLISPHMITISARETDRVIDLFIDNALALLERRPMRNLLNKELFY